MEAKTAAIFLGVLLMCLGLCWYGGMDFTQRSEINALAVGARCGRGAWPCVSTKPT